MSDRINNNSIGNINNNNADIHLQDANQRNSAPDPQANSLANAVKNQSNAVNNQIANQQGQGGNILENAPNLLNDPALNVNQPKNNPLDSSIILSNALLVNNGDQNISRMDESLFVTGFIQQNNGINNYVKTGSEAPNLVRLQELASDCDLEFKIKCAKHFKSINPVKDLRVLYNASSNSAQRAYVDLLMVHTFAFVYAKEINAQLPADKKNPDLEKNLQVLIGNLISASSDDDFVIANAELMSALGSNLSKTGKPDFINKFMSLVNRFITGLETNKKEANRKISELASSYNEAVRDISKVDPEKLLTNESPFISNKQNNGLPSQCGIVSNYVLNDEESVLYSSFVENRKKIDKLINEKNELDRILRDPNLKGYSIDQIKARINKEAFGNEHLLSLVEKFEKKKFEDLKTQIKELFDHPGKNDAFANAMMTIFTQISRDLSSQKAGMAIDILRDSFKSFDPNAHPDFANSLNFRTLKALVLKTEESQELKAQFPEVIRLLGLNRFCLKGFMNISVAANAPVEQRINAAVTMIENFAKAVNDPAKAKTLLRGNLQSCFNDKFAKFAYLNMVTSMARLTSDPALKQLCGYVKSFVAVKAAVDLIRQENSTLAGGPDYGAETAQITALLDKISGADLTQIKAEDLKKLLDYAVNVPLPQLNAIWNTVLYAAYHAHIGEKIESGAITDAPSRVYSVSAEEDPFAGLKGAPVDKGIKARNDFINSLSDEVKARLDATGKGVVREKDQIKTVTGLAHNLNSKLSDNKALQSVLVSSDKGKSLLAVKEMRQDIYTFGDSWSFSAYDDISDPDELIKIGINKKKLYKTVNKDENITAEYRAKLEARDDAIGMPTINRLLSAQNLNPGDPVRGENVAVSISLLRDNLVDDASQLDPAILSSYGIDNKELITFSKEEFSFAKEYANYELKRKLDPDMPEDPAFSEEKVQEFKYKCFTAQAKLEDALAVHAKQNPLSKVTKLLLNRYIQVAALNNASSLAMIHATNKYIEDNKNLNLANLTADKQKDMNMEIHLNALATQARYFDAIENGQLETQNEFLNVLVSDLTNNIRVYDLEQIQLISGAIQEPALSTSQKKELISNLKILNENIDPKSFTAVPEDPVNGKTALSRDLLELSTASDESFGEKLNAFIANHLNLENTSTADSLLVYKVHENHENADAAKISVGSALTDAAMQAADGSNLQKIRSSYIEGYGTDIRSREVIDLDNQIRKGDSEVLAPIANKLMSTSAVRDEVRLASSYAAAKLGYASKNDLYSVYKNPKTSLSEKNKIEQQMMHCLKVRGFDTNMSRLLAKSRLNETSSQFILTKMFRSLKSHFFSAVNDVKGLFRSAKIFFGGLPADEAEKRSHDFHEYLPAMKEMVNRIGDGEIRYVNQNMDFKVNFNPFAPIDSITGGALKNNIVKVKASLALNSNAAMAFTRNADGKLSLLINASVLNVGLGFEASFKPAIAGGAKAGASGNLGLNNVLELKFDNDDEAASFMCKMFTSQLSEEDVRLASDTASGSSWSISGKVQVKASLGNIVQGFMHHDELDAINNEKDDDAKEKLIEQYAKDHPIVNNIVNFTKLGVLDLSYTYTRDSKSSVDNTGSTHEVHTTHEIGKKIKLFEFTPGSHELDYDDKYLGARNFFDVKDAVDAVGDVVVDGITRVKNKKNPKKAEQFVESAKNLGEKIEYANEYKNPIYKVDHTRSFHTSATTGMIDDATDKTVTNKLRKEDLDELKEKGLINDGMKAKLEELIRKEQIKQVTFVRKLKPSVFDTFKNDKKQLEKECYKVSKNYILTDVIIESKGGPSSQITNNDWLDIVSGGYASFKTETNSSSNNVLRIRATNLGND